MYASSIDEEIQTAETIWIPVIEAWGLTVFDRERRCERLMSCILRREIAILIYIQNLQANNIPGSYLVH